MSMSAFVIYVNLLLLSRHNRFSCTVNTLAIQVKRYSNQG